MLRRFREHDDRLVQDLSGIWDFAFLGDVDPDSVDMATIVYDDRMAVPGCFDATPKYAGRRGLAAYHITALVHDDSPHRLILDAVHHWCRVFAIGKPFAAAQKLGDHIGGFTRFAFDLVGYQPGEIDIVVLVDNRIDYDRCPLHLDYFDWYHFGGIARGAELHRLGKLWINALDVVTLDAAERKIGLTINYGALAVPGEVHLQVTCDGEVVQDKQVSLSAASGQIRLTLELPGTKLWSPDAPNLHMLHVTLKQGGSSDDVYERIGIRQVETEGQQILINGQAVRLLGYCRHAAHPQFGHGLPEAIQLADVQLLKDLGCNFVRGSHYPQDVRFLDLCDEAGLCVWNEVIGWQHPAAHLTDPHFIDAQLTNMDEMVAMSKNRPSVIMWGILNESHSNDPDSRPAYETLLGHLRELDPTRPVTFASNHPFDDLCLDLVDIVAINCYPGWYQGEIEDIPDFLDQLVRHLDEEGQPQGTTFADKPLIISEIGAGAIPGWRDMNETRWSEQYQAKHLATVLQHLFVDRRRTCGISLWQFCDCRSSEQGRRALFRPRAFNNKGTVDEYRRPKLAYEVVKRYFTELIE